VSEGAARPSRSPAGPMRRVVVLGLGEAGAAIAGDLSAAGTVQVDGYDPGEVATPAGVVRHDDPRAAVAGAELVLAVTSAAHAADALAQVVGDLSPDTIYADLSTSAPGLKRQLAGAVADTGAGFTDVALMAPVPGRGIRTPALASGPAAEAFVAVMRPLGMPVEAVGGEAGQAACRKLLRSVVMKGLAQLLVESLAAAEAAGVADETWDNLVAQLSSIDRALVRRLVTGTGPHARRRLHEMEATIELLGELGVDPVMSRATATRLGQIADDPTSVPRPPPDVEAGEHP
jgi:3-hydroxyisobutyrate dehydrogenase-like beta-hydroxyacid dehydrogenase